MRRSSALVLTTVILCAWGLVSLFSRAVEVSGSGVTVTWAASPDPSIVGYYVYYGPTSGNYTQRIDVGNSTSTIITGLPAGSTNYFVATAYNAVGMESLPSNEVSYINPGTISATIDSSGKIHLLFPVAAPHSYDVQSSTTLTNWITVATIFAQSNSIYDFVDSNRPLAQTAFYRLLLH